MYVISLKYLFYVQGDQNQPILYVCSGSAADIIALVFDIYEAGRYSQIHLL